MADISKITIESGTYDIKDATARTNITTLNNALNYITDGEIILNGDSYGNESGEWTYELRSLLVANGDVASNSKVHIWNEGGASAIKRGGTTFPTYLQILQNHENDITDKSKVKAIILCAGYNDNDQTTGNILGAFETYINYCKTNYPNAQIYFGMIGWTTNDTDYQIRASLVNQVLRAYQNVGYYGGLYLHNIEYVLHNYSSGFWSSDGFHPANATGKTIAYKIYQAYKTGSCDDLQNITDTISSSFFANSFDISMFADTRNLNVFIRDTILGAPSSTYTLNNDYLQTIDLGVQNVELVRQVNNYTKIPINVTILGNINGSNNFRYTIPGFLSFNNTGHLFINYYQPFPVNTYPTITNMVIQTRTLIDRLHV